MRIKKTRLDAFFTSPSMLTPLQQVRFSRATQTVSSASAMSPAAARVDAGQLASAQHATSPSLTPALQRNHCRIRPCLCHAMDDNQIQSCKLPVALTRPFIINDPQPHLLPHRHPTPHRRRNKGHGHVTNLHHPMLSCRRQPTTRQLFRCPPLSLQLLSRHLLPWTA